jgi:formylglycine-generating enzyme required for sulfatase activity
MKPSLTTFILASFCFLLQPQFASAKENRALKPSTASHATGKRIALVIGNGNYQHADRLPKLANPPHDAEDIARALRGFGFEVIERRDQNLQGMNEAITEFSRKIGNSEAALFYFAGHGLQVKGQNYIVPVDAKIDTEASVEYEGVNVNRILDELDNGKSRANIVMLDACRNNPISGKFRSGATRGLAVPSSTPKGTVIVYATDPGNVAADGNGRNGLFTAGLLTAFKGGDLSLGGVLARASEEVERGSAKKQTPYVNGPMTLQKHFLFAPGRNLQVAYSEPTPIVAAVAAVSSDGIEMIAIPGKNFELGKYEVTQKQWREIMGSNPSSFSSCGDNCPVESVSFDDVKTFITNLNAKTGGKYRLPSEAEWDFACRGDSDDKFCGGSNLDGIAWFKGNSDGSTHPVGQKDANAYGLYDMSGNVWEWTSDCWEDDCGNRALCGGAWGNPPNLVQKNFRANNRTSARESSYGFRLARTLR